MTALPTTHDRCWARIGVWGDRSCPELTAAVHCHNCPVFGAAGRGFLEGPPPAGYLDEWTARLAEPAEARAGDRRGVLVFRLGGEWLALSVTALHEVIPVRPVHRVPLRGGLLAGIVNVRGELHLAVHLDRLLGIARAAGDPAAPAARAIPRLLVAGRPGATWVLPADEVDRVHRIAAADLAAAPPTLDRAAAHYSRGVFRRADRAIGWLDEERLFETLRTSVR